jgi:hypothetical protein
LSPTLDLVLDDKVVIERDDVKLVRLRRGGREQAANRRAGSTIARQPVRRFANHTEVEIN